MLISELQPLEHLLDRIDVDKILPLIRILHRSAESSGWDGADRPRLSVELREDHRGAAVLLGLRQLG